MGKFNSPTLSRPRVIDGRTKTVNLAGGEAYQESPKLELASLLLTSMVQDQFYRSEGDQLTRLGELVDQVPPTFAAKAAVFARNEYGMRSITHALAGELAARVKGQPWAKDFYAAVVRRPDDITEILSYYLSRNGKPLPNSLKKGLARAFGKFDGYQLAKYRGEGNGLSLVDAVNLVHPRPTDKNAAALSQLVNGTLRLAQTDTWESALSAAGSSASAKAEAWEQLLRERKIGYFALLRNLRNIEEQAPGWIPVAAELLQDENLIRKSLVLPFRFTTALDQVTDTRLIQAINGAVDISLANVPTFDGSSLIVIDHSGSMGGPYAYYGGRREAVNWNSNQLKGDLFAAALFKANSADVMVFGTDAGYVQGLNPSDSTLTVAKQIAFTDPPGGHGTNFPAIFGRAKKGYDRIVIFSDMQGWIGYDTPEVAHRAYRDRWSADPFIYSFDLAGYGTLQFPEPKVFALAGFSEKTFDVMKALEADRQALVHKIEAVQL
jgi:60 kDa SS-A/Ro ribonucleoprotein